MLLGIDLGTTNSLGCIYRDGKVELIPNQFQSFLTPSVVSIDENGKVLTGQIAKERLITHPNQTIASFKKNMGDEGRFHLGNQSFLPEELSSFIIRSIVEDAKKYTGEEIDEVVISVPAYFHDKQRYATKRAGVLAGVTVNRLINEPSAAALSSYCAYNEEELMMVFDFGGGTLDISLVDCFDTIVEIIAVTGDNHLGGDDFHEIMVESFLKEHQLVKGRLSADELALLYKQAEGCKRELSEKEESHMSGKVGTKVYRSVYTNKRLLDESAGIFLKIRRLISDALKSAQMNVNQINQIVLAGGSCKMPIVESYISHLFHKTPIVDSECDELIVRGLGYVCGIKERQGSIKDMVLTDICPFSLGEDTRNEADPLNAYFTPIIERNTTLPCSRVKRFFTVSDNQTTIQVGVFQGEKIYAKENRKLAEYKVRVPKNQAGKEAIDVRFTYDIDGILMVDITVVSTGETLSKIVSQPLDEQEAIKRMEELEKMKVHPKDESVNKLLLERLKSLYEEANPELREYIGGLVQRFEYILEEQNPRKIKNYRKAIEKQLEQFVHYDPLQVYEMEYEFEKEQEFEEEDSSDWEEYKKKWTS